MNTVSMTLPKAGLRTGVVRIIAAAVAIAGWLATGSIAAIAAGVGLVAPAATDLGTHRFSTRALGGAAALVALALTVDAAADGTSSRLVLTAVGSAVTATLLTVVWFVTPGLAFGDVLLVTFTVAVPLHMSALAVAVALGVALFAAAAIVVVRVAWRGADRPATVPLAPALLIGWLAGVVVG
jgi:hypothetical protein